MFSKQGKFLQHLVTATIGLNRPQGVAIRNHPSYFILYITYGDMKANKVVEDMIHIYEDMIHQKLFILLGIKIYNLNVALCFSPITQWH
jgi:hypothetical protein